MFLDKVQVSKKTRGLDRKMPACLAARVSIFFCIDGIVSVCCRNRTTTLGRYPEMSLSDMWHGVNRLRLHDALGSSTELPPGCESCNSEIMAGNAGGLLASKYDQFSNRLAANFSDDMPLSMEFEIGNICNLECVMCSGWKSSSIRKNREKLPPLKDPYDDFFLDQLRPFIPKLTEAKFLGGEPFLNKTNFKIWQMIEELNPKCEVGITTNGSMLNDPIKRLLKKLNAHIVISTESVNSGPYEVLRKNAKFAVMMKNLEWFHSEGLLNSLSACAITQNYMEIPDIVRFCDEKKIYVYFNDVFDPPHCSLANLSKSELENIIRFWERELNVFPPIAETHLEINRRRFSDLIRQARSFWIEAQG